MGWLYSQGSTLKSQINVLTKGWENHKGKSMCLAHCFRGNILHQGILWSVWEQTIKATGEIIRYLHCDLLEYSRKCEGWGYKPIDETMGPLYYNCPLKYLNMVPVDKYPQTTNKEWRKIVLQHHERRRARRKARA